VRVLLPEMALWRHDLCECLHNCLGILLVHYGQDPELVLGAVWDFYYPPHDVRPEEYYYPCRWPTLVGSIVPYHPLTSRWYEPADGEQGWQQVKECLLGGRPAIVAVDNYYLPFRPAYQDVHTNHVVVVYGFDEQADSVFVMDPSPPAFQGSIRLQALQAARSSQNPALHERDLFFTNQPIANRWLDVAVGEPFPALTRSWVTSVLQANSRRFREQGECTAFCGLAGMERYFGEGALEYIEARGAAAMDELVLVSVAFQEATALHADFLRAAGQRLDWWELIEASRQVDLVAHDCTPIRIMAARGRMESEQMRSRLASRFARLLSDHATVVRNLERIAERA
jgi:hypothetical protein